MLKSVAGRFGTTLNLAFRISGRDRINALGKLATALLCRFTCDCQAHSRVAAKAGTRMRPWRAKRKIQARLPPDATLM